ncbi:MAG TPA: DUF1569 domain-containing protein [Flavipsychrobacter sp.]|nr:DUF1569 domain-containing protein [Flavipsychrobacter sp.]
MKTILDKTTRDELIHRINRLDAYSVARWGKMNVYQMMKHCSLSDEMYLGKKIYKRMLLGHLIGQMALKNVLKDDSPLTHNAATLPEFRVKDNGSVLLQRDKWIETIAEYANFPNGYIVHWFFGKMTREQVGYFAYKHIDHHLRQFNG